MDDNNRSTHTHTHTHTHTCMDINDKYRTNFCRWCHCTEILKGRRYLMEWTVLVTMLHPLYLQQLLRMGGVNTRIIEQLSTCNLGHLFF